MQFYVLDKVVLLLVLCRKLCSLMGLFFFRWCSLIFMCQLLVILFLWVVMLVSLLLELVLIMFFMCVLVGSFLRLLLLKLIVSCCILFCLFFCLGWQLWLNRVCVMKVSGGCFLLFFCQDRWYFMFSGWFGLGSVLGIQQVMMLLLVLLGVGICISFMWFEFYLFLGLIQVLGCDWQLQFRFLQCEKLWLCCIRLKFCGLLKENEVISRCLGFISGCQSYLLVFDCIDRLFELCIFGWKLLVGFGWFLLKRNMLVSGVMFSLVILLCRQSWVLMFMVVFMLGLRMK